MHKALRERLLTDPALQAMGVANVFPEVAPEDEPAPTVIYTVTSGESIACQDGRIHRDTVEFTAYSSDKAESTAVGYAIAARLDRFSGTLAGQSIQGISLLSSPEDAFAENTQEYACIVRALVTHQP